MDALYILINKDITITFNITFYSVPVTKINNSVDAMMEIFEN